jgi:hypothetical protein
MKTIAKIAKKTPKPMARNPLYLDSMASSKDRLSEESKYVRVDGPDNSVLVRVEELDVRL